FGALILYGTWRGAKFLVDPSPDMWYAGTCLLEKTLFGTKWLRIKWYVIGGVLFLYGVALVIKLLIALFQNWWATG
ncbi:MAG: hypothetical protein OEY28_08705, partial [Nitrospira sp.]|nr:hypothetical protein [Nitrospira sp.]